jgi:hypothetical protein
VEDVLEHRRAAGKCAYAVHGSVPAEQDLENDFLVIEGDGGDLFRQREDHVEVLHRQQFGEALRDPAFARRSRLDDARVLAVVAAFDGAAQRGGTAVPRWPA